MTSNPELVIDADGSTKVECGGAEGIRTPDPLLAKLRPCSLSLSPHACRRKKFKGHCLTAYRHFSPYWHKKRHSSLGTIHIVDRCPKDVTARMWPAVSSLESSPGDPCRLSHPPGDAGGH